MPQKKNYIETGPEFCRLPTRYYQKIIRFLYKNRVCIAKGIKKTVSPRREFQIIIL